MPSVTFDSFHAGGPRGTCRITWRYVSAIERGTKAVTIGTLNGAKYLERDDEIGTIAVGKQADLVVIDGDPSARIEDVRKVNMVFKQGVGYDPEKLIASVRGRVGLF